MSTLAFMCRPAVQPQTNIVAVSTATDPYNAAVSEKDPNAEAGGVRPGHGLAGPGARRAPGRTGSALNASGAEAFEPVEEQVEGELELDLAVAPPQRGIGAVVHLGRHHGREMRHLLRERGKLRL
ncbi:hypothetical protein C8D87_104501 [Lentzea atacamensis]|uniref:Uncharacterized protein n=1 Tax=Lentzea atacamensis TaxID=531938 RepID=A0ABX9EBR5_9PSEU|nr:hypothetical protein C8D87_104501 [Lentzea atacamensis]